MPMERFVEGIDLGEASVQATGEAAPRMGRRGRKT
jgi:hypothetical protein